MLGPPHNSYHTGEGHDPLFQRSCIPLSMCCEKQLFGGEISPQITHRKNGQQKIET